MSQQKKLKKKEEKQRVVHFDLLCPNKKLLDKNINRKNWVQENRETLMRNKWVRAGAGDYELSIDLLDPPPGSI